MEGDEDRESHASGSGQRPPRTAGEPGMPGSPAAAGGPGETPAAAASTGQGRTRRRYSPDEKRRLVESFLAGGVTQQAFCAREGVSVGSLASWRRFYAGRGTAGLAAPAGTSLDRAGGGRASYSPEQKREIVEALEKTELTQAEFALTFGISRKSLIDWRRAYREGGPKALETRRRGRRPGSKVTPPRGVIAREVQEEIVATKRRFPDFGMRKIRDFLLRFRGMKVSPNGVGASLERAGVERAAPAVKRRRKPDQVRRFERALPMDLWQSDITSFFLGKESRRVYLTVFIDDFSRYVVAWALRHQQRAELVIEALRDGIARFGKPKEVLTDQGRQYFAWRGKSEFQRLLHREGIGHVVARAHHPETVGKCERLWSTIQKELWSKLLMLSIDDARERLSHFLRHYNHFRPHQGIGGLVPADRFFSAEDAAKKTIEATLEKNELAAALAEKRRRPVFLFGQIGDRQVSLHGESGKLVIQTDTGTREEIALDETTAEDTHERGGDDHDDEGSDAGDTDDGDATAEAHEEAPALQAAGSPGAEHPRDLGEGERRGEGGGASTERGDPRDLARADDAQGCGRAARDPAGQAPSALPTRDERAPGGPPEAAQGAQALDREAGGAGRDLDASQRMRAAEEGD